MTSASSEPRMVSQGTAADGGIVFVNDGSRDQTLEMLQGLAARCVAQVKVIDQQPNSGKAEAVRVPLLGREIERKPPRHYAGRVFATAASVVLAIRIYDTQCGAKLTRVTPQMRQLFEKKFGSRWIFDVEMLARYLVGPRQPARHLRTSATEMDGCRRIQSEGA